MARRRSQLAFSSIHQTVSHGVDAPFSVAVSLSLLLGVIGLVSFGLLGMLGGVAIALLAARFGPRFLGTVSEAPDLVGCSECGEETLSSSGRCPAHR